jgi:hypothetical protein
MAREQQLVGDDEFPKFREQAEIDTIHMNYRIICTTQVDVYECIGMRCQ